MSINDAAQIREATEVSIERAYEIAETLCSPRKHITDALTLFSGDSPEHGSIHVVIPPLGRAVMLPFATLKNAA